MADNLTDYFLLAFGQNLSSLYPIFYASNCYENTKFMCTVVLSINQCNMNLISEILCSGYYENVKSIDKESSFT